MEASLIEELRDDVLRKIGRNILNLQRMEVMLKILVVSAGYNGTVSELRDRKKAFDESVARRSMGILVENLFRSVFSSSSASEPPEVFNESWISCHFSVEDSEESVKDFKNALTSVVEERNKLIHQMLCKFDADSVANCREMGANLDLQNERIMPVFKRLRSLVQHLEEARSALVEAIDEEILSSQESSNE